MDVVQEGVLFVLYHPCAASYTSLRGRALRRSSSSLRWIYKARASLERPVPFSISVTYYVPVSDGNH